MAQEPKKLEILVTGEARKGYGLTFLTELPIPEYEPTSSDKIDVHVRVHTPRVVDRTRNELALENEDTFLDWPTLGQFVLRGTSAIDIYPGVIFERTALNLPMQGPVAATLMHKRGHLVLHAGSVLHDSAKAIIIAGDQGVGKSTTVASLVAGGFPLLCDDVVSVTGIQTDSPSVISAFPQIKLCRDAADRISIKGSKVMPPPDPLFEKITLSVKNSFKSGETPIGAVFILTKSDSFSVTPCSSLEGFEALMRYSYMAMRAGYIWTPEERATHFRQCAELSSKVPVFRLGVPRDVNRIGHLIELIHKNTS